MKVVFGQVGVCACFGVSVAKICRFDSGLGYIIFGGLGIHSEIVGGLRLQRYCSGFAPDL